MAAYEAFEGFLSGLSAGERDQLKSIVESLRQDLSAARSEEARLRIVHDFIRDAPPMLRKKRGS